MAYRECPNHGWLETAEYTVTPHGETICPVCEIAVSGHYDDVRTRMKFGDVGGPTHSPRPRFVEASQEFSRRIDELKDDGVSYDEARPIMDDFDFDD